MTLKVNCPTCHKSMEWKTSNPNRPFCSDRCKLIDLGCWAAEEHKIPGSPVYADTLSEQMEDTTGDLSNVHPLFSNHRQ
ncbi:DNA gyrase inhibitor YacG [Zooshikella ganghwensis]|uniref:DNA gyrase inhibitor YacG n=2 Tax=Zooshikella ganghwensis TaxID=202772 RepID=A0A4P9VPJ3_9GAMM|nr:DNA gyrase inhibitor YacG [Zooshikella ganghwensis]RDH45415.1 DNA gyrase inhibitor YacG [Zooshikella ganghwensis]